MAHTTQNTPAPPDLHRTLIQLISYLVGAVNTTRLYAATHPRVAQYIEQAFESISVVLEENSSITILVIDDDIVADNRRLISKGPHLNKFIQILKEKRIEGMALSTGLSRVELEHLVKALATRNTGKVQSSACITMGRVRSQEPSFDQTRAKNRSPASRKEIESMQTMRDEKIDEIKAVYNRIENKETVDIRTIEAIITEFIHRFRRDINPLALLASVKASDDYTFTHAVNVCILTMFQAENLGFSGEHLHRIGIAASLHDTGKLFIPDEIINKPGKLTGREWDIMAQHPLKGAQYLLELDRIPRLAVLCCLEHHVRIDADGYPAVPSDHRPNIVSQMISISDAFDAMRSRRVYRDPLPLPRVVKILRAEKAKAFNPRLVDHFLKIIER